MSLDEFRIENVPQLTAVENDILAAPFTEKEVFEAISQMKNKRLPAWMDFRLNSIRSVRILLRGICCLCSMIYSLDSFSFFN